MWTETATDAEYRDFLRTLRNAVARPDGFDFLDDDEVRRGVARPAGYDEMEDDQRRRAVRSTFMQDAQDKARERYEAAQLVQAQVRRAAARKEAQGRAKARTSAEEGVLKSGLKARLGRDPTAAEVTAARDAALIEQLAHECGGRLPTAAEIAAAVQSEVADGARTYQDLGQPPWALVAVGLELTQPQAPVEPSSALSPA